MTYMQSDPIPSHLAALLSALRPDGSLAIGDSPSCRVLPSPLSELEAKFYYYGLCSAPPLVARTSTTPWKVPTSPETYQKLQELRASLDEPFDWDRKAEIASKRDALLDSITLKNLCPVSYNHPISEAWEDNLGPKVWALLDSMEVKWTSVEILRIAASSWEQSSAPIILWVGVTPGSLSGENGAVVASECHKLLVEHDITDVEVELRESIVMRSLSMMSRDGRPGTGSKSAYHVLSQNHNQGLGDRISQDHRVNDRM